MADTHTDIDGAVATVTIDRPPVNALTIDSYREITGVFKVLGAREDIGCIILVGAGTRAFCAGFDFRQFAAAGAKEDDPARPAILRGMFEAIRNAPVPVIAAVNGPAIGAGCVLAAVCDIRIAVETARFGLPEIDFGRIGGAAYLAPLLSSGCLRRMVFTGQPLSARQALQEGLVGEIVAPEALLETSLSLATVIAGKAGPAVRQMKAALEGLAGLSVTEGYRLEQEHSLRLRDALSGGAA